MKEILPKLKAGAVHKPPLSIFVMVFNQELCV